MRRTLLVLVALAALLVPAGTAAADDQSVYGAYVARDADFAKLGKQVRAGLRVWKRSHYRRPARALRALRKTNRLIGEVSRAIEAQEPSSDPGRQGKAAALASMRYFRGSLTALSASIRATTNRHPKRGLRPAHRGERLSKRADRATRRARSAFREAGVQIK